MAFGLLFLEESADFGLNQRPLENVWSTRSLRLLSVEQVTAKLPEVGRAVSWQHWSRPTRDLLHERLQVWRVERDTKSAHLVEHATQSPDVAPE